MAQRVVQCLELVQVDEQQRPSPARALAQGHRLLQPVEQQTPVGQVGEGVVEGQVANLFLGFLAFADVRERSHVVRDLAVTSMYCRNALQQGVHLAAFASIPDFTKPGTPVSQRLPHLDVKRRVMAPGLEHRRCAPNHLVGPIAGHAGEGAVDAQDGAPGIGHDHAVQRFKCRSGDAHLLFNPATFGDVPQHHYAMRGHALSILYWAHLNVNDGAAVDALIDGIVKGQGGLHVLVNNAGITRDQLAMRMKDDDWDAVLDTNLKAVFRVSRAAIKPMMKQRYGRIISITSVVGASGNPGQANYAAAKAGVAGMTRALARELGSRSVTVNCVAPGFIDTDMTSGLPEAQQKALLDQIPLGHLGKPADIAHAVAYLASNEAGYITGQELHVNGGMYM